MTTRTKRKSSRTLSIPIDGTELSVWLAPLEAFTEAELLERAQLTDAEQAVFETFPETTGRSGGQRRREWLGTRMLVCEELGGRISYTPQGRPRLVSPSTKQDISISHTTGWAAVAASTAGQCGIDIERIDRDASRAAARIAAPGELAAAARIFPSRPALWLWCAKEAAYKAAGGPETDFARDIRLESPSVAQPLIMTVETVRVILASFVYEELLGVCGLVE
ncbi:4'-phosphopantetheinyl transferase superfamily protein [uncultured Rikenella sp.]|uniref:4'-phosphopantetheinyl transferase family protein n=1 Tax=uncultured Rikenella sp. TaxID=368003 RepID=UPI00262BB67C|nr:4'-phosphopantetheinyl transferase superfamily protein [uncultured Rikenella sp.]